MIPDQSQKLSTGWSMKVETGNGRKQSCFPKRVGISRMAIPIPSSTLFCPVCLPKIAFKSLS